MKLCLICQQYPGYTGHGVYVGYLQRALSERGHDVHTLTGPPPLGHKPLNNPKFHILPTSTHEVLRYSTFEFTMNQHLQELQKREKFDLVQYNLPGYLVPVFHQPSLPLIITAHNCILEIVRNLLPRLSEADLVEWIYMSGGPLFPLIERWALSKANRIVTVSAWLQTALMKNYDIERECLVTIHNGIDTEFYRPVEEARSKIATQFLPEDAERPIVLFLGRIMGAKDPLTFVRAIPQVLQSHPETLFLFRGGGFTLQGPVGRLLAKYVSPSSYRFIDFIDAKQLPILYSAASVYVLPSVHDPFPYTLLEAMSCATPIVATSVGGIPEMIENENNGLLVQPANPAMLADGIVRLLENEKLARRLGRAARRRVEEAFTLNLFAEKFEREMLQLAG